MMNVAAGRRKTTLTTAWRRLCFIGRRRFATHGGGSSTASLLSLQQQSTSQSPLVNDISRSSCILFIYRRPYHASSAATRYRSIFPSAWHHPNFMPQASALEKEAWLEQLLKQQEQSSDTVDTEAFLIVLRALAAESSGLPDAALRAERWLIRLEQRTFVGFDNNNDDDAVRATHTNSHDEIRLQPTSECYQRVIEAWAAARKEDPAIAVTRAERWLVKYSLNYDKNDNGCKNSGHVPAVELDTVCYNAFLDLCSKGRALKDGANGRRLVQQHATMAEHVLLKMMEDRTTRGANVSKIAPDTDSFNYVIRAFTRMRFDHAVAENAMRILRLLEEYQQTVDSSVGPNIKSYAMVMDAIAVRAKQIVHKNRNKTYLWKDPSQNGMNQMKLLEEIISYMRSKARNQRHLCSSDSSSLEPNSHAYNVLIAAWANLSSPMHPDAPLEAEKVLQHMVRLRDQGYTRASPDAYSYQMVMRAWKNSSKPNRGARVAWWLQKQWTDYEFEGNDSLQPTTTSYNMVMQVWAGQGDPVQVERVMDELSDLSESGRFQNLTPNTESYAAIIKAWLAVADKGSPTALQAAAKWLRKVVVYEDDHPTRFLSSVDWYSEFLGAARKSASQHSEVFDLALEVFDLLQKSHHGVDCLHYARLVQTGLMALSQDHDQSRRDGFLRTYVSKCCDEGLLSRPLIRALSNGPIYYDGWTIEESMRYVDELFPEWPLPPSWTRNIKQVGYLPTRADLMRVNFRLSHHGSPVLQLTAIDERSA